MKFAEYDGRGRFLGIVIDPSERKSPRSTLEEIGENTANYLLKAREIRKELAKVRRNYVALQKDYGVVHNGVQESRTTDFSLNRR